MARQFCHQQIALQVGRRAGSGEREMAPAFKPYLIRCAAEMYVIPARDPQIAGQCRSANTTTASLEALSVSLPN